MTDHPNATWVVLQLGEASPLNTAPRHLVFDRDSRSPRSNDLCSLSMDLWAVEQGYERLEPSLAGV